MILVKILPVVSKNNVGVTGVLEPLKCLLYRCSLIGEKTLTKRLKMDSVSCGQLQEAPRTLSRFGLPLLARAENNPGHFRVVNFAKKSEDRPAAADFNIVRMSSETEYMAY
jgi:hypothetical protein